MGSAFSLLAICWRPNSIGSALNDCHCELLLDDLGARHHALTGDVIVQVNRKDVNSAADVRDALSSVPIGQDALVLIWSNGGSTFRVLHAPEGNDRG